MIVTCPNCQARYKLSDAVLARGTRLRCAACDHRWVPAIAAPAEAAPAEAAPAPRPPITEADEEAAFAAVQEQIRARWHDATPVTPEGDERDDSPHGANAASPDVSTGATFPAGASFPGATTGDYELGDEPRDAPDAADDTPPAPSPLLRSLVAAVAGLALSVVAAGLWVGQVDLTAVPLLGPALPQLSPPSPLKISAKGVVTVLASGRRVLEVTGSIANPGKRPARLRPLAATLSGPAGTALRWTIAAPRETLPPGRQVAFASTVTGFPAEARALAVTTSN